MLAVNSNYFPILYLVTLAHFFVAMELSDQVYSVISYLICVRFSWLPIEIVLAGGGCVFYDYAYNNFSEPF